MDAVSAPTYEGTLTHYGLSFGQMKIECADELIQALPVKMNRWRTIHLGLDKGVVDAIENDRVMDDEGKRQQLLERWKERFGHEATYYRLARSFFESKRVDLVGTVCEEFLKHNPPSKG